MNQPTAHSDSPRLRFNWLLGLILGILFFGVTYRSTFVWLWERSSGADSYYSHAFLIPLISAYLIWRQKEIFAHPFESSRWGLVLVLFGLGMHLLSVLLNVHFSSGFSMIFFFFGVSLYLFGRSITRRLLFPLAFLFFMVPMPMAAEGAIAVPMKLLATAAGASALELVGIPVVREGFQLYFPSAMLIVGNPCSGIRSLIALTALGSLVAYFYEAPMWKRMVLFATTIPIAMVSNISRVILLSLIASKFGTRTATGFLHDASGFLVFAVALVLFAGAGKALGWNHSKSAGER